MYGDKKKEMTQTQARKQTQTATQTQTKISTQHHVTYQLNDYMTFKSFERLPHDIIREISMYFTYYV